MLFCFSIHTFINHAIGLLFWLEKKHKPLNLDLKYEMKWNEMKEEKTIFKPLAGIEPHIFGLLVRRVNHYTTRTNHAGNAAS